MGEHARALEKLTQFLASAQPVWRRLVKLSNTVSSMFVRYD